MRADEHVERMAKAWKDWYYRKERGSIIIGSLQRLSRAFLKDRETLVKEECWLDVFATPRQPKRCTFQEVFLNKEMRKRMRGTRSR